MENKLTIIQICIFVLDLLLAVTLTTILGWSGLGIYVVTMIITYLNRKCLDYQLLKILNDSENDIDSD